MALADRLEAVTLLFAEDFLAAVAPLADAALAAVALRGAVEAGAAVAA